MTKVIKPMNRGNSELETRAQGCNCKCNENVAPYEIGKAGAWIPFVPGCGCICNSNSENKSANSNTYHAQQS